MSVTKCPNCGASLETDYGRCRYCETLITDAPDMKWYRVDRQMPPRDPSNPSRSLYALTHAAYDEFTFVHKTTKQICTYYDFLNMLIISAYYDFTTKTWNNDLLGKRLEKIEATHWMHIPSISSSSWISIDDKLPPENEAAKEYTAGGTKYVDVLVCDKAHDFMPSVINASLFTMPPSTPHWTSDFLDMTSDISNREYSMEELLARHRVRVTHWMPRPPGPTY